MPQPDLPIKDIAGTGLYLHIPFCQRKCRYCDFFSLAPAPDPQQMQTYVDLLLEQFDLMAPQWNGPLATVYFGGGTPSLLEPFQVGALLEGVAKRLDLFDDAEITLEANPGTIDFARLRGYRSAGVNRLSLGVQSLADQQLQRLGRLHCREEAVRAVEQARRAGFDNLALDLMFALPEQTPAELDRDLHVLVSLQPEHISAYTLTVEEGTPLAELSETELALPDEELGAAMFRQVHERLTAAGYGHYEISNYAQPGRESRHNLGYWQRRPCLGLGAGAHSFLATGWGERRAVPNDLEQFAELIRSGADASLRLETFSAEAAARETLYLGLRTEQGVSEAAFRARFGQGVAEAYPGAVKRCGERLTLSEGVWRFDLQGWLLFNHLISHFL